MAPTCDVDASPLIVAFPLMFTTPLLPTSPSEFCLVAAYVPESESYESVLVLPFKSNTLSPKADQRNGRSRVRRTATVDRAPERMPVDMTMRESPNAASESLSNTLTLYRPPPSETSLRPARQLTESRKTPQACSTPASAR